MRRLFIALLASLLLAGFFVPAAGAANVAAASAVPKVVIVVGPSGVATNRYRSEAVKAAALARKYTPDVTEVYSPNATWPAVKAALQGASLVIYMGHGNGWPSRYRDSLYPPSQNGFGLNPKAGSGDYTHQYFGEGPIAKSIKLADNAVVLLNHLCYASGNTEPGLPEGNIVQARQRVDNFAAGFIRAGASAVIAEAYTSPNYMIRTILGSQRSIDSALEERPVAKRQRVRLRQPAQPRVHRPDGSRARHLRLLAQHRAQGRSRLGRRPARCAGQCQCQPRQQDRRASSRPSRASWPRA